MEKLDLLTSIKPNKRQKIIQDMGFYAFIHFTVNTFTGREWGTGKESPKIFDPYQLSTDQWCESIKSANMKGVILTAKHHDGFCLWQTKTTEHSIKNSPYKDGKGDIVKELSKSCRKYGLKLGIYLSPWDRNSEFYGTEKYMDFYIKQLTELLTNYGDVFMLWLDGACASHRDGKAKQVYDFDRIYKTALALQPNIVMSGCGPDVRWVGNEAGKARESEWNVVPRFDYGTQNIDKLNKEAVAKGEERKVCSDTGHQDMGSQEFLKDFDDLIWYPAEVDVSIRLGWFHHFWQKFTIRSIKNLMKIYYKAVGGNSLLLLNIPPNKRGLFDSADVKRLKKMGEIIKADEKNILINKRIETLNTPKEFFGIKNLIKNKTYSPELAETYDISIYFNKTVIDKVNLQEDTDFSQRVEAFTLSTKNEDGEKVLYSGTVIGFNKIALIEPILTDNITLTILKCRKEPFIKKFEAVAQNIKKKKEKVVKPIKSKDGDVKKKTK